MRRGSTSDPYLNALKATFDDKTPVPTTRTREEIERDIAAISKELKGPMNNVERLCLVEAKNHLRNELRSLDAVSP